jgi:hypothetical protein
LKSVTELKNFEFCKKKQKILNKFILKVESDSYLFKNRFYKNIQRHIFIKLHGLRSSLIFFTNCYCKQKLKISNLLLIKNLFLEFKLRMLKFLIFFPKKQLNLVKIIKIYSI